MAETLIYSIQFTDNNPGGGYVSGDVVRVFYDPDLDPNPVQGGTAGLRVTKNNVTVVSGADIAVAWTYYKTETPRMYLACGGPENTIAVGFTRQYAIFPYLFCSIDPDWPGCNPGQVPCDLQIIGTPFVYPASAPNVNDGYIIVTAASSRPFIEYKIGSDFTFAGGDSQPTGEFYDLYPGTYMIFVRDNVNCKRSIQVVVGINNTYSPQYTVEYNDALGTPSKVVIARRAWDNGNTDVIGGDVVFERQLRGEASTDKFEAILATQGTLKLVSEINYQFGSIFTNNPDDLRMYFYKNFGAGYTQLWSGKVLTQQYQEDYKAAPYYVNVVATDGLADLKDQIFAQDDGQQFIGTMRQMTLLSFILKKTGLLLPIRSAVNMFASLMNTGDVEDDPFDQAYVDVETYYLAKAQPDLEFVLRCVLEPYGARVVQENNRWNIIRVEELAHTYAYRDYDVDGVYIGSGTYNPIVNVDVPSEFNRLCWSNRDQQLMLTGGYGRIKVFNNLGLKRNILRNGDFRLKSVYNTITDRYDFAIDTQGFQLVAAGYGLVEGYEVVDNTSVAYTITGDANTTGEAYLLSDTYFVKTGANNSLKLTVKVKIPLPKYSTEVLPNFQSSYRIPYQRVRVEVKYDIYYLRNDGFWTTTPNILSFFVTEFQTYQELTITGQQPADALSNGGNLTVKLFHSNLFYAEYQSTAALKAKQTWDDVNNLFLPTGTKTEYLEMIGPGIGVMHYYELQQNSEPEAIPKIIRPNDYDAVDNPVQWVRVDYIFMFPDNREQTFYIDSIGIEFLTDGVSAIDTVVRDMTGEPRNPLVLEKTIYHSSYMEIIETIPFNEYAFGVYFHKSNVLVKTKVQNILSPDLIYAAYLRSSNGTGFESWSREQVPGTDKLHGIFLKQYVAQYNRSWKKITGSLYSEQRRMDFISTLKDVFNDEILYIPIALTINDRDNKYNGEFLELMNVYADPVTPFSSGFTTGFGQAGFN